MKINLLCFVSFGFLSLASMAQCDPDAYDWGSAAFGVSPDPTLGENFEIAEIGQPYADIVFVKCPTTVGDIDPENPFATLAIDSISLDSITIFNGLADVQMATIGLNVTCNNNGDSPNPCMFYPGNAYCGDIIGTPTVSGTFDVQIWVTAHAHLFASAFAIPYSFPGYTLVINGPNEIVESTVFSLNLQQNSPNPVSSLTNIHFDLSRSEDTNFEVINLLGEVVYSKSVKGKKGDNLIRFDSSSLQTGVYLYSIQSGDKKNDEKNDRTTIVLTI